jgi:16S rRNA (guanine(966)-N(2))-methyltransferase RsmD
VRGAIFDALEAQGADFSRVLDLYAGSGALGIEALSRGGGRCDFVERSETNVALIKENLRLSGFETQGRVHRFDAARAPERLHGPYTLVLADPPYEDESADAVTDRIASSSLVSAQTALVLEQSSRRAAPERLGGLERAWGRRYGDTEVSIYRVVSKRGEAAE